ncbi:MAG: MFS transporter [Streptosporangiaceae bacterium]
MALPTLTRELGATTAQLQWVVDACNLVFAALLLTSGSLSDRFGRKGMLMAGLLVFGLASFASPSGRRSVSPASSPLTARAPRPPPSARPPPAPSTTASVPSTRPDCPGTTSSRPSSPPARTSTTCSLPTSARSRTSTPWAGSPPAR